MGNTTAAMIDIEQEYQQKAKGYLEHVAAVKRAISTLCNPDHSMIMNMRYVDGMMWEDIALKANYSLDWCYKYHRKALRELGIKEYSKK